MLTRIQIIKARIARFPQLRNEVRAGMRPLADLAEHVRGTKLLYQLEAAAVSGKRVVR